MANFNTGKHHSLGYVNGSFYYGLMETLLGIAGFFIFGILRKFEIELTWEIILIVIFADVACWSFAVSNFACFVLYKIFGSGSSGKIINSYNLSPSYDTGLYKSCNKVTSISLIIGSIFTAAAVIIVIVLIKRYRNANTNDDLNALKPYIFL